MSSSDTRNPARPPRRFSAIMPAVRRPRPSDAPPDEAKDAAQDAAQDEGTPAAPVPSSAASAKKASDEARIAKVMARAGLCSRRDAEAWILEGRVAVNGATIDSPALNVGPGDTVTVDGYPIDKPERTRLFLFHKARGLVTTARDPEGRPTVFDALPPDLPRLVTIGRLDINTEGLLLLTNDGGLARMLELPATGWIRRYRVRANGTVDQAQLDALAKGITIDGVVYAGIAAKLDRVQGANLWLTMGLKEGKNREIKRVLEHLGLAVTRLIRISFGPFQLGELGDNAVEEVRTRVLRDQLGSALAKQAGIDFEGPTGDDREKATEAPAARAGSRGKAAGTPEGPRRQTRRTATADRRGRAVAVERITTAPARQERGQVQEGASRRDRQDAGRSGSGRSDRPPLAGTRTDGKARSRASEDRPQRARAAPDRARDDDRGSAPRPVRGGDERRFRTERPAAPNRASDEPSQRSRATPSRARDDDRGSAPRPARGDGRPPAAARSASSRDRGDERPWAVKRERSAAPAGPSDERPQRSRATPARNGDDRRSRTDRPAAAERSPGSGKPRRPDRAGSGGDRPRFGGPPGKSGGPPGKSGGKSGGKGRPPRG